jgi:hypothetical protein
MKHFTNLTEFLQQLKVGNKISIIEHKLTNNTTDDLHHEGIIAEIGDNYFCYEYKTPHAVLTKTQWLQTETTWAGSLSLIRKKEPFCAIYHSKTFGESSTIMFNSINGCYTYALHPDKPSCCPTCKGSGMTYTTITTFGEKEKQISIGVCFDCKGEVVDEEEGVAIQEHNDQLKAMWCNCNTPIENSYYVPDRPGVKHHWNCGCCHKLRQVG